MKVPDIFVPEKDLEKKTEKLKEQREISLEELMGDNMRILHGDAENKQRIKNIEYAASKIIKDTLLSSIKWEEDIIPNPNYSKCYTAKAIIQNYKEEPIIVPVTFLISESPNFGKFGSLYLGDEKGLELNSFAGSEKIKYLLKEYFKQES